ncbi:MAG: hypothetical protein ACYDB1_00810 [Acidiferrobacteraceae bacterium]
MNVLTKQILEEGYRNAVVKLAGVLDSSNANESPAISLTDFTNNDSKAGSLSGLRVDHINFAISDGIEVQLLWNSLTPQLITPLAGRSKIDVTSDGGLIPDMTQPQFDGNINLTSTGWTPGSPFVFNILLRLVKLYKAF